MHLNAHDLKQLDQDSLNRLSEEQVRALAARLLADLKEAIDRLNRTPQNSSLPPSKQAPWEKAAHKGTDGADEDEDLSTDQGSDPRLHQASREDDSSDAPESTPNTPIENKAPHGRPGRRPGAPGVSRTQHVPVTAERFHAPQHCAVCGVALGETAPSQPYTARLEIDVQRPDNGMPGLVLSHVKHTYLECQCGCGHWTRAQPGRADADAQWTVELTEWHLAGPMLVALICFLAMRMRLSRARIQELLHDWLGLDLGVATINQCLHEAARALEPVVVLEIVNAVREAKVVHADETSWFENGRLLWLWVFTCVNATLFVVGPRTAAVVAQVLGEAFENWLMSDGYGVYRGYDLRLRCLTHIIRKARGLAESLDRRAREFGIEILALLAAIIQSVYQARAAPPDRPLREVYAQRIQDLFDACVRHADSGHEKTRALARELLNDWDTFWVVLDHPELPLTNNDAERALRHWVIARLISYGTRTGQGSRVFALLASVIETCRKRSVSPWPYIAEVLSQRRNGLPAPALPVSAA